MTPCHDYFSLNGAKLQTPLHYTNKLRKNFCNLPCVIHKKMHCGSLVLVAKTGLELIDDLAHLIREHQ